MLSPEKNRKFCVAATVNASPTILVAAVAGVQIVVTYAKIIILTLGTSSIKISNSSQTIPILTVSPSFPQHAESIANIPLGGVALPVGENLNANFVGGSPPTFHVVVEGYQVL